MAHRWLATVGRLLRRCRRWLGGFDYRTAYRNTDLERDYWSIVGPASKEEFEALGQGKCQALIEWGLTPHARVLDVGCGTGQLAAVLVDYLSPQALYYGTDIAPEAIAFCQEKIRRANFFFRQNDMTRLPLEGILFDVIYFGSVFTHLYPGEIHALLADVKRLLDVNGLIIADAFVAQDVVGFRGDRGMVVINEERLGELFAATGLCYRVVRDWTWSPGVRRAIYKFTLPDTSPENESNSVGSDRAHGRTPAGDHPDEHAHGGAFA